MALRLDDLQFEGLKIFQNPKGYCFTSDSVLLANFVKFNPESKVVEFCAGTGVISILLTKKQKPKIIHSFEVMREPYEIFLKSIAFNKLSGKVVAHLSPLEEAVNILGVGYADVVVCNPPYLKAECGESESEKEVATKEIKTSLESVIYNASRLLKFGGKLFMVHRVDRLVDVLTTLRANKLEPKRLSIIYPKLGAEPVVFLVEALSGGKSGLRVSKVIFADDMNKASSK